MAIRKTTAKASLPFGLSPKLQNHLKMLDDKRPLLLVEDDEVDVMTVKRCMRELKIKNRFAVCGNGEEAIDYLEDSCDNLPALILLDINMPRMNGIEFLSVIKKDDRFKRIPVIVLTTSKEEQDRYASFDLSAAGYMIKPVDYQQFLNTINVIKVYWSMSEFAG